jgi:hypothetical protein
MSMASPATRSLCALAAAIAMLPARPVAQTSSQPLPLDAILRNAGAYVEKLVSDASGVVLEEDYSQQVRVQLVTTRHLRSDLTVLTDRDEGWIEFRDVFEVDDKPVRDRDDRLAKLFTSPNADARAQARRIIAEGSRYNLDVAAMRISRSINLPMTALRFLWPSNQSRSRFNRTGYATVADHRTAVVEFRETAKPRIIGSADDSAARGTLWIEPDTGIVLRSQLQLTTARDRAQMAATITVAYALDPKGQLWLPRSMEEHYDVTRTDTSELSASSVNSRPPVQVAGAGGIDTMPSPSTLGTIEGQASYSNIRRFNVAVEEHGTN